MNEDLSNSIRKYLRGKCSPEERLEVERWYASFEKDTDLLNFLSDTEKEKLRFILLQGIRQRIRDEEIPRSKLPLRYTPPRYLIYTGVAAILAILVGIHWLISTHPRAVNPTSSTPIEVLVQNTEKSIQRIVLPDGSTVWLHPNSSLTYPESFHSGERTVSMKGEVFFDIVPDSLQPFVVYSGDIRTKVLGTSFRIRAYNPFTLAEISVMTGKVSVKRIDKSLSAAEPLSVSGKSGDEIVLIKNERLLIDGNEPVPVKQNITRETGMTMWQKNDLAFKDIPIKEVLKKLNMVYNVKLTVTDDQINNHLLKADFSGMHLPDVLEILKHSLTLEYELLEDEILLITPE